MSNTDLYSVSEIDENSSLAKRRMHEQRTKNVVWLKRPGYWNKRGAEVEWYKLTFTSPNPCRELSVEEIAQIESDVLKRHGYR